MCYTAVIPYLGNSPVTKYGETGMVGISAREGGKTSRICPFNWNVNLCVIQYAVM